MRSIFLNKGNPIFSIKLRQWLPKSFSQLHVKNSTFFRSYFLKKDDWPKAYADPRLPNLPYCPFNSENVTMLIFARYFLYSLVRCTTNPPLWVSKNYQWTTDKKWWSNVQDFTFGCFYVSCNERDVTINRNKNIRRSPTTLTFFCRIGKGKERKVGAHLLHDSWAYIMCVSA